MNAEDIITGSDIVVSRFGHWPSFHDAEVLQLSLDRRGTSGPTVELFIHVWRMTDRVDEQGHFVLENHTLVRFVFEGIHDCELGGFNIQNVLSGISISPSPIDGKPGIRIELRPCFGLGGSLLCTRVVITEVTPCDALGTPISGAL